MSETSFYQIDAQASGVPQQFFAAYRNQQFVLFQIVQTGGDDQHNDGAVEVLYLLPAATAGDIPRVISHRLMDVKAARLLDEAHRPLLQRVRLLVSHPWTEMERGIVGVILGVPPSEIA